ncbi:MAG: ABC transporter, partial [Gemella morbillorum]|nr:ABC transporter [Gemella morbillorum]
EIKIKSFKNLLTAVILITTFILTLLSIVVSGIDYLIIGINILSFVLANLLARVFIAKVK